MDRSPARPIVSIAAKLRAITDRCKPPKQQPIVAPIQTNRRIMAGLESAGLGLFVQPTQRMAHTLVLEFMEHWTVVGMDTRALR